MVRRISPSQFRSKVRQAQSQLRSAESKLRAAARRLESQRRTTLARLRSLELRLRGEIRDWQRDLRECERELRDHAGRGSTTVVIPRQTWEALSSEQQYELRAAARRVGLELIVGDDDEEL